MQNSFVSKARLGWKYFLRMKYLYLLLVPCLLYYIIFRYVPMYGVIIAFKEFSFKKGILGSDWIGLSNFKYLFSLENFYQVFKNSITLSALRLIIVFPIPIILALLLNEMKAVKYTKFLQTVIYLPHFISWVVIGGILVNFLSPSWGVVNQLIKNFGGEPIFFMAKNNLFKWIVVFSSVWKEAGWGTIIYLAAITGISPELYEAAIVDGANKFQKLKYITLPGIKSTVILTLVLRMGTIMNNGFEQIFVLQNSQNLSVSEVFETYVYRLGIIEGRYSFATTVGLFTSVICMVFLVAGDLIAKYMGEDGIF